MPGASCKQVLSFQEYLSFDNDDVTYKVQSLEQIMDSEFTSDVSEDGQAEELGEEKEW